MARAAGQAARAGGGGGRESGEGGRRELGGEVSWGGRGEIHTHTPWGLGLGVGTRGMTQALVQESARRVAWSQASAPALEAARRGQMRERRVQRLERCAYQEGVERGDEGRNSAEGGAKWRE